MMILSMDTSTYVLGTAIGTNSEIVAEWTTYKKENHSLRLMPGIDEVMNQANLEMKNLTGIVVTTGPGSYTGVRIGVATAKAMASSLDIPLYEVSSLELLAQNGKYTSTVICPFIDARRGQVYAGLYESNDGEVSQIREDELVLMSDLLKELDTLERNVLFLSLDLENHKEQIQEVLGERAIFGGATDNRTKPSEMIHLASKKDAATNVDTVVPRYLQLAEAEKNIQKESRDDG
ncbi:tRNA (adenosine(37)-N6)-threonylcarbamoyltransferase complex dimerization subunit type 1 TsaB [Geomicrobium sp. JSM 1781026]